jgi:hypothetical protein
VARTGAKSCVGRGGIAFYSFGLSLDDVCEARACIGDDAQRLCHTWHFPAPWSRNPSANRSLIAFTAWSSFVHAMLMAGQAFARLIARGELIGSAVLVVIGVVLIALAPGKETVEQVSAVVV